MRLNIIGLLFGIAFGGVLAASNLHEYDTIHAMLRLDEFDVFWFMASAIAVSAPLLYLLERRGMNTPFGGELSLSRSMPEKHHLQGGALFGIGWAIAGTCPAPALVMVSSGAVLGLVAIPGIFRLTVRLLVATTQRLVRLQQTGIDAKRPIQTLLHLEVQERCLPLMFSGLVLRVPAWDLLLLALPGRDTGELDRGLCV